MLCNKGHCEGNQTSVEDYAGDIELVGAMCGRLDVWKGDRSYSNGLCPF